MTSAAGIYGGAKSIELMADHLLTYMTLGEVAKFVGGRFDLREFSGAQPLVSDWLAPQEERDTIWYFRDVTPSDLAKPLNVAMVGMNPDEPGEFVLHRYRSMQPKDVRGRVMREYPMYVRTLHAWVGGPRPGLGATSIYGSRDGLNWNFASSGIGGYQYEEEKYQGLIGLAHGMAWTDEMLWHVEIGWVGCPTIKIPTDPVGARAIFRLRDIPEGKQRRAALKHWVTEHWRQSRSDPSEERMVREHLRGKERFVWNGFVCEITPSHDDLVRAKEAEDRRKELRESGEDRRSVVRGERPLGIESVVQP